MGPGDTTCTVADGTVLTPPCFVQIDTEIIAVGNIAANVLSSLTRGIQGTNATSHTSGANVKGYIFAYMWNQMCAEIKAIETALGPNLGNVVTITDNAGGDVTGIFSDLQLIDFGPGAGSYGAADTTPIISLDAKGRITDISNETQAGSGIRVSPVFYKGAIAQGSNAVLGFSFPLSAAGPVPIIVSGTHQLYGVAHFVEGNNYIVQDHFTLPDDWTGQIDLDIYWRTSVITGSVVWQCQIAGMSQGTQSDIQWGSMGSVTSLAITPSYGFNTCTITNLDTSQGVIAGSELFFQFGRSATDTAIGPAELIGLRFIIRRFWNNGETMV